jgi:O-antigen ligase
MMFRELRTGAAARALTFSVLLGLCLGSLHRVPNPLFGPLRLWMSSKGNNPDSGRLEIWFSTLRMVRQSPWFGFGESQFHLLVAEAAGQFYHPHNWPLQILFQWGVIGAICYFALAAFVLHKFYGSIRIVGAAALPAFLVATSLLVYSLYEGTLYHPYPISMLIVAITWTLACGKQPLACGMEARPI